MEILNQYDEFVNTGVIIFVSIFSIIGTVSTLIATLGYLADKEYVVSASFLVATAVLGSIAYFSTVQTTETETLYEATISDFNAVYNAGYEIVEQRGQIYVLRKSTEKESE